MSLGTDKITGKFDVIDPNFNDTSKLVNYGIQASETDKLTRFGYKSKKIGGLFGTKFEFFEDVKLGWKDLPLSKTLKQPLPLQKD